MENIIAQAATDGTPSSTEVVSKVLSQTTVNSTFLKNVGLQKSSTKGKSVSEQALREELEAERAGSALLREELERLKQ